MAYFHAEAPELDELGRVVDFGVLKEKLGGWVDTFWDHGFIFWDQDTTVSEMLATAELIEGDRVKSFALPYNPTAENMARYLLDHVAPNVLAGTNVTLTKVVLWETENCFVEVERAE